MLRLHSIVCLKEIFDRKNEDSEQFRKFGLFGRDFPLLNNDDGTKGVKAENLSVSIDGKKGSTK